jgi:DNA-binding NarL/FixJ family response regulator
LLSENLTVYEVLVLPLRILIADDHDLVRKGIRSLLEAQKGWEVIGEARDGRDAVEKAAKLKPDVIILDHGMPRLNGLEAVRRIMKVHPQAKVLIVTMHDSDELIREVLDAGARGYVTKSDTGQDLVVAVEALSRNKTYFTSKVDQMVLDRFLQINTGKVDMKPTRDRLTSRQREIVQLLAEGKTSKEVATILGLSTKTVETHRAQIMRRLDCHSVSELVRYAIRNNIVQP